jgi:riboflavin kinase
MTIQSLKKLALLGAHINPVEISSSEFASLIDTSPQTAARRLKSLDDEKLITRQLLHEGQVITITKTGVDVLNREYYDYQEIFSGTGGKKVLKGQVITGLGEGQYYISLEGYRAQFREKLGFDPFPGTLNIRLDKSSIELRKRINPGVRISGFTDHNRTFGSGSCFNININGIKGAVIIPERTHYPEDIIEVIAPVNLREHLDFKDGSKVHVEVLE